MVCFCFLMLRRLLRFTRTDTLFLYPTLCRSQCRSVGRARQCARGAWRGDDVARGGARLRRGGEARSVTPGAAFLCGARARAGRRPEGRSEEHTSELQSLMRISYAVF